MYTFTKARDVEVELNTKLPTLKPSDGLYNNMIMMAYACVRLYNERTYVLMLASTGDAKPENLFAAHMYFGLCDTNRKTLMDWLKEGADVGILKPSGIDARSDLIYTSAHNLQGKTIMVSGIVSCTSKNILKDVGFDLNDYIPIFAPKPRAGYC